VCKYWLVLIAKSTPAFTDVEVALYLMSNSHLQNVSLRNYDKLTNETAKHIAKLLEGVTVLDLSSCRKIDDEGVSIILEKVRSKDGKDRRHGKFRLQQRGSRGWAKGCKGKKLKILQHGKTLQSLTLSNNKVTDKGIQAIATQAPNLTKLNVSWIYASDLTPLSKLVNLTALDLSKNSCTSSSFLPLLQVSPSSSY
jgi:Leucine-rich repeat (LRR) protein